MQENRPSRSAAIIAAHRAMESLKPECERVCFDPYAEKLLPPSFTVIGESPIDKYQALELFREHVPGFHEYFIVRTRYMDDLTIEAVQNGISQLVILGAGYDTRAYRLKALTDGHLRVFEIDHPATQAAKREKLTELFTTLPDYVTFVPFDFKEQGLPEKLQKQGYLTDAKTLFLLEGVSMYLAEDEAEALLRICSMNSGPGSAIIFDFTSPEVIDGRSENPVAAIWRQKATEGGEPLTFGINSEDLQELLARNSFYKVKIADHTFLNTQYFTIPGDSRKSTPLLSIASAQL